MIQEFLGNMISAHFLSIPLARDQRYSKSLSQVSCNSFHQRNHLNKPNSQDILLMTQDLPISMKADNLSSHNHRCKVFIRDIRRYLFERLRNL